MNAPIIYVLAGTGSGNPERRRMYFFLRRLDGVSAALAVTGQPQVSSNGAAFTNTGIGTLTEIGGGQYYADLTTGIVATAGLTIKTRFGSADVMETEGSTAVVVAFDMFDATALGLTLITAINAKTTNLPASPAATGAAMTLTVGERNSIADAMFIRSLGTESYAADSAVPTFGQWCFMMMSKAFEMTISGTTMTCKKLDGLTTSMTFTLNDATTPSAITRTS